MIIGPVFVGLLLGVLTALLKRKQTTLPKNRQGIISGIMRGIAVTWSVLVILSGVVVFLATQGEWRTEIPVICIFFVVFILCPVTNLICLLNIIRKKQPA